MSVVKSKRNKSKVEFEMIYFQLADGVDTLVEHNFFAEGELAQKNRIFLEIRYRTLEDLSDKLLYYIKIANSIYPICMTEWEERRLVIGKAIGTCYAILTNYQRIMQRLRVPDNKYTLDIQNVVRMINSLKAWRKSDNLDALYKSLFPVHEEAERKGRNALFAESFKEAEKEDLYHIV